MYTYVYVYIYIEREREREREKERMWFILRNWLIVGAEICSLGKSEICRAGQQAGDSGKT